MPRRFSLQKQIRLRAVVDVTLEWSRWAAMGRFYHLQLAWSIDYSIGVNQSHLSLTRMDQSQLNWIIRSS